MRDDNTQISDNEAIGIDRRTVSPIGIGGGIELDWDSVVDIGSPGWAVTARSHNHARHAVASP